MSQHIRILQANDMASVVGKAKVAYCTWPHDDSESGGIESRTSPVQHQPITPLNLGARGMTARYSNVMYNSFWTKLLA